MLEHDGIIYKTFVVKQKEYLAAEKALSRYDLMRFGQADVSPHDFMKMGFFQMSIWFQNWIVGDMVNGFDHTDAFFPEVLS